MSKMTALCAFLPQPHLHVLWRPLDDDLSQARDCLYPAMEPDKFHKHNQYLEMNAPARPHTNLNHYPFPGDFNF